MHGEAWVNHAIQEADLLLAMGMRFDDRVTGNLKNYAPMAQKIHFDIDLAEMNKIVKVDLALVGDMSEILDQLLPHLQACDHDAWLAHIDSIRSDSATRDIVNLPGDTSLHAAHVINDIWRYTTAKHWLFRM